VYPVKQRWFASDTQMANEPVFVDWAEFTGRKKIYYHFGLDFGGAEGLVEVVSATDGIVLASGDLTLKDNQLNVDPRYDVVYIRDDRSWCYRYSHLKSIDPAIKPGVKVKAGQKLGMMGKEGGSGGWSHLHFDIKAMQPSGKLGTQAAYAFAWQAYQRQYKPKIIAVARPHHLARTGDEVVLDGTPSWSQAGKIARYEWILSDGSKATGPKVKRIYEKVGAYSEILKVTDVHGRIDYDFAVVQVVDRENLKLRPPTVHAVYYPTFGIKPGDEVTFKVRSFGTTDDKELWNFGDGSPKVAVKSDGNVNIHNPHGYAVTTHRYKKPGHYVVTVERRNKLDHKATAHLHVRVGIED